MVVGTISIKLDAPWVQSLKEKRMLVKSITARLRNKFNVSAGEVDLQDIHKTLVIGIAYVTTDVVQADKILHSLLKFVEDNSEAEIIETNYDIIQI